MHQSELARVERLAGEIIQPRPKLFPPLIRTVPHQRMPQMRKMNPDLMGASGLEAAFHQRRVVETLKNLVVRPRVAPPIHHRHPGTVVRMAADRRIHGALLWRLAAHHREVNPLDRSALQLTHQIRLSLQGARHDKKAAGVFVEAMDNAGARNAAQFRKAMQQPIEKRSPGDPAPRVDHKTDRLIDHDKSGILMEDRQGDILRRIQAAFRRPFRLDAQTLTTPDLLLGVDALAVEGNPPFANPGLQSAARMFRVEARQREVQTEAAEVRRNGDERRKGARIL